MKLLFNALMALCFSLCLGTFIMLLIALYDTNFRRKESNSSIEQRAIYPYKDLKNLVMVAGLSVYTGSGNCNKGDGEEAWYLEAYQKHPGQLATFVDHIRAGIESGAADENALLLFSGGETRKDAGPRSEAQSYWNVADTHQWFGWAFADALLHRLARLWIGARGLEFTWDYLLQGPEANANLVLTEV